MSESVQRSWSHNALSLCTTAVAIAATASLFVPLESALRNWDELTIGFAQLLGLLALPFAVLAAVLLAVGAALTGTLGNRGPALLSALLLCVWLQSQFLVWDYGVFDGSPIDWGRNAARGWLELAVWSGCFALAAIWPDALARRALAIAGLAIVAQSVALGTTFRAHAPFAAHDARTTGELAAAQRDSLEGITAFSSERNVVVLVLDTLQSDFFAELLADPAFAASVPPGFTYYRNAVAPYPHTQHSLPAMLSAKQPTRQPPARYTLELMKGSAPALLAAAGWHSAVLTTTPPYLACNQLRFAFQCESQRFFVAASQQRDERDLDEVADARSLWRIGAFRAAPHFAKRWLYDAGRWRVPDPFPAESLSSQGDPRIWHESRRDLIVWDVLTRDAHAAGEPARFKFLHFFAAHHPSSIDARCEWNGLQNPVHALRDETMTRDRRVAVDAAQCALMRAFAFLDRLDELGLYDSSLVFIVGDHGRQHSPIEVSIARPPIPGVAQPGGPEPMPHRSKGVPLLLAKRMGERGPLQISDRPVSLCDLPRSIFGELGLTAPFECESIFEVAGEREEPRLHFRGMPYYETPFSVYRVDGHSWLPESWQRVERGNAINPQ